MLDGFGAAERSGQVGGVVLHMGTLQYSQVRPAVAQSDLTTIAPYM